MRLELINTRSTILPRSQFALHHHMFRERDSNHASTDPKSIVLPLDDPGVNCRRGANRTPKALKHRFYRAARFHLRTTLRICRVTRIRTWDFLRPRQARTTKLLYYPMSLKTKKPPVREARMIYNDSILHHRSGIHSSSSRSCNDGWGWRYELCECLLFMAQIYKRFLIVTY